MRRLPLWVFALSALLLAPEAWARGSRGGSARGGARGGSSYGSRSYGSRSSGARSARSSRSYAPRSSGARSAPSRSYGTRSRPGSTARSARSSGSRGSSATRSPRPRSYGTRSSARPSTSRSTRAMRSPNSRYRYVNRTSARTDRSRGSAVGRPGTATRGSRTRPAVATPRTGARTARGATTGRRAPVNTARYGYRGRHTHVAPVSHTNYHSHYHSRGYYCSWHFGHGRYYGCRFYSPYYNYCTGRHIAFFYAAPVAWVYVPFGFYDDYEEPVYVTTKDGIDEEYAEEHDPKRYERVWTHQVEPLDGAYTMNP